MDEPLLLVSIPFVVGPMIAILVPYETGLNVRDLMLAVVALINAWMVPSIEDGLWMLLVLQGLLAVPVTIVAVRWKLLLRDTRATRGDESTQ